MPELLGLFANVAGMALLALAQERHWPLPTTPPHRAMRIAALLLISLALPLFVLGQGGGFGSLLWVCTLIAAAFAVAMSLSFSLPWPRRLARLILVFSTP